MIRPRLGLFIILAVWFITVTMWLTPGLTLPDGAGYYAYLPSVVLKHDLVFLDEWEQFGMISDGAVMHKEITATSHLGNHWTVGSAIAWLPGFAVGHLLRSLTGAPPNGLSLPYNVGVLAANALIGLGALLLFTRMIRKVLPEADPTVAVLGGWFGTPLLFYATRSGISAHVVATAVSGLCLLLALRLRDDVSVQRMISFGLATGFAFTVRPQLAPLALLPLFLLPRVQWGALRRLAPVAAAAALFASVPQWLISIVIYGHPLGFLGVGSAARPFAPFERIWTWEPLFSWYHGLFTWTPFALLGLAGLVVLYRRDRGIAAAGLSLFLMQWFINATLERSFWGAWSFGQRRFDSIIPFVVLGVAALGVLRPRLTAAATAACCAWTMTIFLANGAGLDLSRYYTLSELVGQIAGVAAVADHLLRPLAFVPEQARASVAVLLAVALLLLAGSAAAVRIVFSRTGRANAVVAGLLLIVTLALLLVTRNDGVVIQQYAAVIEKSRRMQRMAGGADARVGLLADELAYLRKSGRDRMAAETERELRALLAARGGGAAR